MTWYQVQFCLAGRDVWHTDGGSHTPRKWYSYEKAQARELVLCKRYRGCSTLIVKVEEIQYSMIETGEIVSIRQYTGILE